MDPAVRPRRKAKAATHVSNPAILDDLDAEDFPSQLEGFADDVITFLDCLNEFPEFTDEAVNTSITFLEGDLKVLYPIIRGILSF
jgi:WD repeat-containing protein 26